MLPRFWVIEDSTLLTKEVILTKRKGNLGSLCLKKSGIKEECQKDILLSLGRKAIQYSLK